MKATHPESELTLREAYERHYDSVGLAPSTRLLYGTIFDCWERSTKNPPVGEISTETLMKFRTRCINKEYRPTTVNGYLGPIRAVLRRLGPPITGNPTGLGIIDAIPFLKPIKTAPSIPRRLSLDDLSRLYVAAENAVRPTLGRFHPRDVWRTLLVVAYFTGLRKSDLYAVRMDDLDLEHNEIRFVASKTKKAATYFLHPCAVEHIHRIWTGRKLLFEGWDGNWRELRRLVGIAGGPYFTLKDIRMTAACEVDRVQVGMGAVFLQLNPANVTPPFVLDKSIELREAIQAMRVPEAFAGGANAVMPSTPPAALEAR